MFNLFRTCLSSRIRGQSFVRFLTESANNLHFVIEIPREEHNISSRLLFRKLEKWKVISVHGGLLQKFVREQKLFIGTPSSPVVESVGLDTRFPSGSRLYVRRSIEPYFKRPSENLVLNEYPLSSLYCDHFRSSILYHDDDVIILSKPSGLVCQSGPDSVENYFPIILSTLGLPMSMLMSLRIVHRLDKHVSGILIIAKTLRSATILSYLLRERLIRKEYFCLTHQHPEVSFPSDSLTKIVHSSELEGVSSLTDGFGITLHNMSPFRLAAPSKINAFCLSPITGRKHQLRIHALSIARSPILLDSRYYELQGRDSDFVQNTRPFDRFLKKSMKLEMGCIDANAIFLHSHRLLLPNLRLGEMLMNGSISREEFTLRSERLVGSVVIVDTLPRYFLAFLSHYRSPSVLSSYLSSLYWPHIPNEGFQDITPVINSFPSGRGIFISFPERSV